jgi:hypothetical protein
MFAALLGSAMIRKVAHHSHPAFVEMLRQMTPAEARFFAIVGDRHPCIVRGNGSASWQVQSTFHDGCMSSAYLKDTPSIKHEWPELWKRYSLGFDSGIEASDALANLERLGIITQRRICSFGEFTSEELHAPWFYSVADWARMLQKFVADGPGRQPPAVSDDLGIETIGINRPPCIRGKPKPDLKKMVEFKLSESTDLLIVQATRWGELLSDACRAREFVGDDRIALPKWAA